MLKKKCSKLFFSSYVSCLNYVRGRLKIISQWFSSWQQHGHQQLGREYSVEAAQRINICIGVNRGRERENAKECNLVLPN